jgi:hypothetical protein
MKTRHYRVVDGVAARVGRAQAGRVGGRERAMGHGADLGTELAADRRLIDLLAGQYEAERDPWRRRLLAARLTGTVARHLELATSTLCNALFEYAPRHQDDFAPALIAQARELLQIEQERMLPALEQAVTWQVLEDLGAQVRARRG